MTATKETKTTKARFTAGPWTARVTQYFGKRPEEQEVVVGNEEFSICRLTGSAGHLDEAMPDALLIAASPCMYAACKPVLSEASQRTDYMHDTYNLDAHVELTLTIAELRAIHAAIAKAEGAKS